MKKPGNDMRQQKEDQEELQFLRKEVTLLNNRLKKSERFKHNFLSNLRNEIVNPISGILGLSSNLVNKKLSAEQDGTIHKMMSLIYEEVFSLHYQLASLLQAADIESGESNISITLIDTELIFSSIREELKPLLEKRKCAFAYTINEEVKFYGDHDKLKLICVVFCQYILQLDRDYTTVEIHFESTLPQAIVKIYPTSHSETFEKSNKQDEDLLNSVNDIKISMAKTLIEMMGGALQVIEDKAQILGYWFTLENRSQEEEGYSDTGDIIF